MTETKPKQVYLFEACRCNELATQYWRDGKDHLARFWERVRDAKFADADAEDEKRKYEAVCAARIVLLLRNSRSGRGVHAAERNDRMRFDGSTTKDGAHNRNTRK